MTTVTIGDIMIDPSLITNTVNRSCDICLPFEAAKMLVTFNTAVQFGYLMLGIGILFGTIFTGWLFWRVLLVRGISD